MATSLPSEPTRQADYRVKPQRNLNEDDANGRTEYGGEGGIRTPDSLATMPDFESGAFNRALPPLRGAAIGTSLSIMPDGLSNRLATGQYAWLARSTAERMASQRLRAQNRGHPGNLTEVGTRNGAIQQIITIIPARLLT